MIFAITLSYIRPAEEVRMQLESHKAWLIKHIKEGDIIFAGPLKEGNGGLIVAFGESLEKIEKMLADDPFDIYHLTRADIQICTPGIRSNDFSIKWAAEAMAF